MSEVALLPQQILTLSAFGPLVHTQPAVALLPSVTLTLVTFGPKVSTAADWPATLPQFFLSDGNYSESPFPGVQETPTDSGIQKTRRNYTAKFKFYQGSVWLKNNSQLSIFENFYNGEADQGNAFFTIPIPSGGGTKEVRITPGSLTVVPDGGIGWIAKFQFQSKPEAI